MGATDAPPAEWERDVVRVRATRVRAEAVMRLQDGSWSHDDLRRRIGAEERRLTGAQRAELWMALVADAELAALVERVRIPSL